MAETSGDPEALQREIERTRQELARAIDAISDRVHPGNATRRGVTRARDAVGEVFGSNGHKPASAGVDGEGAETAGGASAVAGGPAGLPTGYLLAGVGAAVALGAVAFVVVRRRRR